MKIPKLEYEVYYPLYNSNNLTKLDLNLCKDSKIEISIAVSINDSLDKYNPKIVIIMIYAQRQHPKVEQIYH